MSYPGLMWTASSAGRWNTSRMSRTGKYWCKRLRHERSTGFSKDGFYQGLPFSYYVNRILSETDLDDANDIITTAKILCKKLSDEIRGASFLAYLAGFDFVKGAY